MATNNKQEHCDNCYRRHISLEAHEGKRIRKSNRKTYYFIAKSHKAIVYLCNECSLYLRPGSQTYYWPAMIWSFLSSKQNDDNLEELSFQDKWKFITSTWRGWWLQTTNNEAITMDHPQPEVFDVTVNKMELQESIKRLEWISLGKAMDKYLAMPTVHCPWGCGEFLHLTNTVPYEDLLLGRSNYSFRSTSTCKQPGRNWTDSCRKNFPCSTVPFENINFTCRPSIIVNEKGVHLLCCKHHSQKTKERYLHIP